MIGAAVDTWALMGAGVIGMLPAGVGNNRVFRSPNARGVVTGTDSLADEASDVDSGLRTQWGHEPNGSHFACLCRVAGLRDIVPAPSTALQCYT